MRPAGWHGQPELDVSERLIVCHWLCQCLLCGSNQRQETLAEPVAPGDETLDAPIERLFSNKDRVAPTSTCVLRHDGPVGCERFFILSLAFLAETTRLVHRRSTGQFPSTGYLVATVLAQRTLSTYGARRRARPSKRGRYTQSGRIAQRHEKRKVCRSDPSFGDANSRQRFLLQGGTHPRP